MGTTKDPKTGKVVTSPIGASGVTIGYGVDLGQQSREVMKKIGVPDRLLDKFEPYFGKKKWDAVNTLEKFPIKISIEDAKFVSELMMDSYVDRAARNFFRDSDGEDFYGLPSQIQTLLTDLTYHHGSLKNNKTYPYISMAYDRILARDIDGAISALDSDKYAHPKFANRRKAQINLLNGVKSGN